MNVRGSGQPRLPMVGGASTGEPAVVGAPASGPSPSARFLGSAASDRHGSAAATARAATWGRGSAPSAIARPTPSAMDSDT